MSDTSKLFDVLGTELWEEKSGKDQAELKQPHNRLLPSTKMSK